MPEGVVDCGEWDEVVEGTGPSREGVEERGKLAVLDREGEAGEGLRGGGGGGRVGGGRREEECSSGELGCGGV